MSPAKLPIVKKPDRIIPALRHYFRSIYEKYKVLDSAKIIKPDGVIRIYHAMQQLAKKHGGDEWSKNPYAKFWHFRLKRGQLIANNEKRWLIRQAFLIDHPDYYEYTDDWSRRCQPDDAPTTVLLRQAADVFKKARLELLAGLNAGSLHFRGKALYQEYRLGDFVKDVVKDHYVRIVETGTLPPEALIKRKEYDSEAEGDLIYVYVTEQSLNALMNGTPLEREETFQVQVDDLSAATPPDGQTGKTTALDVPDEKPLPQRPEIDPNKWAAEHIVALGELIYEFATKTVAEWRTVYSKLQNTPGYPSPATDAFDGYVWPKAKKIWAKGTTDGPLAGGMPFTLGVPQAQTIEKWYFREIRSASDTAEAVKAKVRVLIEDADLPIPPQARRRHKKGPAKVPAE